jgi:hypothetical protein
MAQPCAFTEGTGGGPRRRAVKRTSAVVIVALLHASCAHHVAPVDGIPFPPDGTAVPLLPPALELPHWWPKGVPAPTKEPLWMTYPETWREA